MVASCNRALRKTASAHNLWLKKIRKKKKKKNLRTKRKTATRKTKMVSVKDLTPLILGGAVIFVVARSGLFKGLGGVGEGAAEAAGGLGAGISTAGRGLGGGIGRIGEAAGYGVEDILSMLKPPAAGAEFVSEWIAGQTLRGARERAQAEEIDIAAFEAMKEELAKIQAEKEKFAKEQAQERARMIEEQKTQVVGYVTGVDEAAISAFQKAKAGLLKFWQYSPMGLLTSYIQGVVSVEETTPYQETVTARAPAPQEAEGSISYAAPSYIEPVSYGGGGSLGLPLAPRSEILEAMGYTGQTTQEGVVYTEPVYEPEPEPERGWYDPRGWFGW